MKERIQKYLAECGIGSRRANERLVAAGRVEINGVKATVGQSVEPGVDKVTLDGKPVVFQEKLVYLMMNKPVGLVTTVSDPGGRPTVMSLLPPKTPRVFPVGRLDLDSHGLLLFTNDGALAHRLLHPSHGVWKCYQATVEKLPPKSVLEEMEQGVELTDGRTAPCKSWVEKGRVYVELKEGKKRQVRRMLGVIGHPVQDLQRVAFGPLRLGKLLPGQVRALTEREVAMLRQAVKDRPAVETPRPRAPRRR